jgi:PAS domain S-box-containing protein
METTFMTIHNLLPEANILYASESIIDILGFQPNEVIGRSCFEYFHPDEVPFARKIHNRGVLLDKAAVLHYARIRGRNGEWIGCECVFTIVHDVLVACTSIYKQDHKSEKRAQDAPAVRRLFASSPKDPRYHMLQHLSTKFQAAPEPALREPRAALILNRFTRTLTIMYSTEAVSNILGLSSEQIQGKSFYECIQENCLPDAIRCLESAKANDSIAYLRFWYRDPRRPEELEHLEREASNSSDSEDGGVPLHDPMDISTNNRAYSNEQGTPEVENSTQKASGTVVSNNSRSSSGLSTDPENDPATAMFDREPISQPSRSVSIGRRSATPARPVELEAVVSCTSDGLVVILRRARPIIPTPEQAVAVPQYRNGLFAAPWGANPIQPQYQPEVRYTFGAAQIPALQAVQAHAAATGGPQMDDFMNSIREVAVFAWSLTGINGNIADYGRGIPRGEAVPRTGFPVWNPQAQGTLLPPPENQARQKWEELYTRVSEPVAQQEVPYVHARQEQLLRQQWSYGNNYYQSDAPGSAARSHLGPYIGEDGRGPGYYQHHVQRQDGMYDGRYDGQPRESGSNSGYASENNPGGHSGGSGGSGSGSGSGGDRFLWQ